MQRAEAPPVACWCTATALCTCVSSVHYPTCMRQVGWSGWGRGDGGWRGGFITALLAGAVKHDWGHEVPVSLSIPGEISQSLLTVINVSGDSWCCRSRAGTAGVYCSFRGGKELFECSACRSIPKVNNNGEVIVFVVKFVHYKQNWLDANYSRGFGIVVSINPHSACLCSIKTQILALILLNLSCVAFLIIYTLFAGHASLLTEI